MSDIATRYHWTGVFHLTSARKSPGLQLAGQSLSSRLTSTMGTHRYSASFTGSLSSSTLSSSYSSSSSCTCSCSLKNNSTDFWQRYQRGRKLHSFWKSIKMILTKKKKANRKAKCCSSESRGRNIQQFYEDLYFRENRNRDLSDSFQASSNSDQTIYSIIDEELYYVPYQ